MSNKQKKEAERILACLDRQDFFDWHQDGRFASYIRVDYPKGDKRHVSKDDILKDIVRFFRITE